MSEDLTKLSKDQLVKKLTQTQGELAQAKVLLEENCDDIPDAGFNEFAERIAPLVLGVPVEYIVKMEVYVKIKADPKKDWEKVFDFSKKAKFPVLGNAKFLDSYIDLESFREKEVWPVNPQELQESSEKEADEET